jgi:formate hydrogenlyase subunit 3/multisubunit Na+/H+ antiporter MnhD subunit
MSLIVASLAVFSVAALFAVLPAQRPVWCVRAGIFGACIGGALGLLAAVQGLLGGTIESMSIPWSMPGGELHLGMDPLSALFLLPITGLGLLGAIYGAGYQRGGDAKKLGVGWFHYNLLLASMVVVVTSRNAILFLIAWEVMALSSFFLVTHEHEKPHVRTAGWIYLVATHLGTAFLLALFVILGEKAGSYEFSAFARVGGTLSPGLSIAAFFFALIGFGAKAGFIPLHVWLPEAHPAAPSHVSALMSGVMIKTGIYGLIRLLACLGAPPAWWGWCLLAVGLVSAIMGVLLALSQNDLKRLLAYCSVENIGVIAVGLGVGYLGLSHGSTTVAVLGFAGALLHVLNHAIFKGLLFLGAGSVLHGAGTGDMNRLGGLYKRMPWTGTTFLIGAAAISGLPPLNGFVSEFLIYFGAFSAVVSAPSVVVVSGLAVITGLALTGGVAAACFAKAFGGVFLGEPRSDDAVRAHEANGLMRWPMVVLAACCVLIGFLAPLAVRAVLPAVGMLVPVTPGALDAGIAPALAPLGWISAGCAAFTGLVVLLALLRAWLLSGRTVGASGTWDCGYAKPTARMQYTASSFAQPLMAVFSGLLGTRGVSVRPKGLFPENASFASETPDLFRSRLYDPLFTRTLWLLAYFRGAQHGRVQMYVLYVALTLIAFLIFSLG